MVLSPPSTFNISAYIHAVAIQMSVYLKIKFLLVVPHRIPHIERATHVIISRRPRDPSRGKVPNMLAAVQNGDGLRTGRSVVGADFQLSFATRNRLAGFLGLLTFAR